MTACALFAVAGFHHGTNMFARRPRSPERFAGDGTCRGKRVRTCYCSAQITSTGFFDLDTRKR
jgi:hypothetical protein